FGTSDLDRGLIGHLLNGYDARFVKTNMRKTSRTPKPNMAGQPAGFATPAE
ncbi:MAG TPA: fatty acid hydroxylase family protein, partial [Bradyrhizobium sp.]|nr:fatty acid hydroxylase family protein [Bradyrhizobium sp.]